MYLDVFDEVFYPQLKSLLRKQMRVRKSQLSPELRQQSEHAVFEQIERLGLLGDARHILLYHSLPDELPTHATLSRWADMEGRRIYLPRVSGDALEVVPYDGPESMSDDNPFGIAEPCGAAVAPDVLEAVIVPGVAFDRQRNRLGRGKGYYDRLLARGMRLTIGVAFDCQLVRAVPCEPHDRPLDAVVTPSHLLV